MALLLQTFRVLGSFGLALSLVPAVHAQIIAAFRVGDGSGSLSNGATASNIYFYDSLGNNVLPILNTPGTGSSRLTVSGSATSEGLMTRSTNVLSLTFGGYDADIGTRTIAGTSATVAPRVIGQVDSNASYTRIGSFGTGAYTVGTANIRGVLRDNNNYWGSGTSGSGSTGGIWFQGGPTQVSTANNNTRAINAFNDQLYFSTGSGTPGIYAVGSGFPTNSGNTATLVIATGTGSSPYAFQINTAGDTAYIADDRTLASGGGIKKYTWNGSAWILSYTLAPSSAFSARGLVVDWTNQAAPKLYASTTETNANRIQTITDTGIGSGFSTVANADPNTAWRGIDFFLNPATWTNSTAGTQSFVLTNTSTSGISNTYRNWSNALADGNILSFQNVNSTGSALAINPDNNSATMTNVARIQFPNSGPGTNTTDKTSYNISGNALTLNGGGGPGADVINDSGVAQTISLNLGLNGARTIQTSTNGNLTMAGQLTGTGSLTKTGAAILTLNGNASYSGTTTVNAGTLAVNSTLSSSSAMTVNSTAILRGIGVIASPVNINAGGTLAPGNSIGTLSINNSVTFSATSTFAVELNGGTTAGTDYDQLFIGSTGSLTLNNAVLSVVLSFAPTGTERIYLTNNDFAGAISGTFNGLPEGSLITIGAYSGNISYLGDFTTYSLLTGNDVVLYNLVAAIP
ncbi:MAG TPA: autotransporter-associated beta strand repeat-containing protein, partial [Gemmatales bacterium]|nr:autotransporter-associated beta strand repeat-containing protein [Gemmatales bacterium]